MVRLRNLVCLVTSAVLAGGLMMPAVAASAAPTRGVTNVRVTGSQHVKISSSLRPGYAAVHVSRQSLDGVLFVRKKHHGLTTLVHYLTMDSAAAAAKRQRLYDFVVYVGAGSRSRVFLSRGTYYVFDANAPRLSRGMVRTVTVHGARLDSPTPAASTIVQSRTRAIPASVVLRHRYLRLVDRSPTNFFTLFAAKLPAFVTSQQTDDVVAAPTFAKLYRILGPDSEARPIPTEVGPGHAAATSMTGFGKGRYLIYTGYGARRAQLRHGDVGVLTIR